MNRRSFVSILTGMCGAVVAGLGFWKKQKLPADPSDLPWRKGRKSDQISFPDVATDTPLVAHGPSYIRQTMIGMEDGSESLPPVQRFILRDGKYIEITGNKDLGCPKRVESINQNWMSAPQEWEEFKWFYKDAPVDPGIFG